MPEAGDNIHQHGDAQDVAVTTIGKQGEGDVGIETVDRLIPPERNPLYDLNQVVFFDLETTGLGNKYVVKHLLFGVTLKLVMIVN